VSNKHRTILETLGIAGGLSFLLFYTVLWLLYRKRQRRLSRQFNWQIEMMSTGDRSE